MASYGGKHAVPTELYHSVPPGWDVESVVAIHRELGGHFDLRGELAPPTWSPLLQYRGALYAIAAGVRAGDPACVELAVRFIELHFIGFYAGFLRALMARRLKHVTLSEQQRQRLSFHFFRLVQSEERCREFKDFVGLWRSIVTPRELEELEGWILSKYGSEQEFVNVLVEKLRPDARVHRPRFREHSGSRGASE